MTKHFRRFLVLESILSRYQTKHTIQSACLLSNPWIYWRFWFSTRVVTEKTNLRLKEVCRLITSWFQGLLVALKDKNRQQIDSGRESQAFTRNGRSIFHTLDNNRIEWYGSYMVNYVYYYGVKYFPYSYISVLFIRILPSGLWTPNSPQSYFILLLSFFQPIGKVVCFVF